MDKYGNMTRKEACFYLGIGEKASDEQIKRAYRYKAKLYHPDANPDTDTKEYYIKVQKAYEFLINNPYVNTQGSNAVTYGNKATNVNTGMYWNMNSQMGNQQFYQNQSNIRPAKVYSSSVAARANYKRQKEKEKEREKLQKWDEENKSRKKQQQQAQMYGKGYADSVFTSSKNTEEEILDKIRAIWLAETIKRQIALDKEHKEALQRRKLYQAFMQQKIQEDGEG